MLKQIFTQQLFASPLIGFEVTDAEMLNEQLMEAIDARRKVEPGKRMSNHHGWHSENDLFVRQEQAFKNLTGHITRALLQLIKSTVPAFDLARHDIEGEGWVNVNGHRALNVPHAHGAYLWSGVYYVQVPEKSHEKSGMLEFLDPRNIVSSSPRLRPNVLAPKFQVRPSAGKMFIFPSYLVHWVYPNEEESERVSIAFNAKIVTREHNVLNTDAYA